MVESSQQQPEFSRILPLERIGEREIVEAIAANEQECAALARRFGLVSLADLSASLSVLRVPGTALARVSGRFVAEVVQTCVVTLEPTASRVEDSFSQLYALDKTRRFERVVFVDVEAEVPPEPAGPLGIDLGEAVAQQLALALDPYPRAPGAAVTEASFGTGARDHPPGPFAALGQLKRPR